MRGPGKTLYRNWNLSSLLNDRYNSDVWQGSVGAGQSGMNAQTVFRERKEMFEIQGICQRITRDRIGTVSCSQKSSMPGQGV